MKKCTIPDFCADRIDIITNVAVITNTVIKRVHYNTKRRQLLFLYTALRTFVCLFVFGLAAL